MSNYNELSVIDFKYLLDTLIAPYKKEDDLEYLKETLRQVKNLVHQANLEVDQNIVNKTWETFDTTACTKLLSYTFPNLKWEVEKSSYSKSLIVIWTGKLQGIEIEVKYYNTHDIYSVSINFDYKDESTFSPYCESTYSTIEEVIQEIKDIIIPIQNTLSKLQIN